MNRRDENSNFSFDIRERLGVITEKKNGWKKELNIVCWNGREPAKFDIRDWSQDHSHMGRGITLYQEEIRILTELYRRYEETLAEQEAAAAAQPEEHNPEESRTSGEERQAEISEEERQRIRRELKEEVRREMEQERAQNSAPETERAAAAETPETESPVVKAAPKTEIPAGAGEFAEGSEGIAADSCMVAEAAVCGSSCGSCEEVPF